MKLNIEIELTEEQLAKLKNSGKLSIAVVLDKTLLMQDGKKEDEWPDAKGNRDAETLINIALRCGLRPNELSQLTISRIENLLLEDCGLSRREDRIREIEKCLGLRFIDRDCGNLETIYDIFSPRISMKLSRHRGVVTLADLKTLTADEVYKTRTIGKALFEEYKDKLNSMYIT